MPISRNTLMRIKTLDECLCRRQRKWTLEDLHKACQDALAEYEGVDSLSLRTTQRDIELMRSGKLGYYAPIVVVDRKYYIYEDFDFSITRLPLSEHDLAELSSAMDIIRHYQGFSGMSGQEDILARMQDKIQYCNSHRQVVYIETNAHLKGLNFLGPLYDFINKQQPLVVKYHSFKSTREIKFHLSPYLLKEFNNRWFLLAYNKPRKELQTLALDRMVSVCADTENEFVENTFFDPETYFAEMVGVTRGIHMKPVTVTLKVDADQTPYIETKPILASQYVAKRYKDGSALFKLKVILNRELERVILGYGNHIEVIAPRILRHNVAKALLMASAHYTNQGR